MLKKLKRRFMIINMSILTSVFLAIFISIYFFMYQSSERQSMMIMNEVAKSDGMMLKMKPPREFRKEEKFKPEPPVDTMMLRNSMTIKLNKDNEVIEVISGITLSEDHEEVAQMILEAIEQDIDSGFINTSQIKLRFLKMPREYGQIIVVLDRTLEIATLSRLVIISLGIGGVSLVAFFFISLYLASWAIKPIGKAWENQRRFVADASHELKTPLTVISTNVDLVLSNGNSTVSSQAKWIEYIKAETERMSKLVNDLLYLAKVDDGEVKAEKVVFNMSEAIINSCLPFESLIFELGKHFEMNIEPDIYFEGDEGQIKQLVVILLDNAIKNSDERGRIEVNLKRNPERNKLELEVSNTGEGIPKEHIDKIFERFYRMDSSRARTTGGYGLGLAIAGDIVKQHKGSISVKSQVGEVTTFSVHLTNS